MKALVTGASGFLGRHLCPELERRGWELWMMNHRSFHTGIWPTENNIDAIFHLASHTQAGDWCLSHAGDQWLDNEEINTRTLKYWQRFQPQAKLITIGSSCAYAPGCDLVEEAYMLGEPHPSLYTYAMTKRMLFEGCRALNKQYGMKYLYLVPSTLYGPNYHTDGRQAHFIFDLIRKIIRGKELGEKVVLWGDGYQRRDIIYVEDFVNLMLRLNDKAENDIFNLSGYAETIMYFANKISQLVGYDDSKIEYDTKAYVGSQNKSLSIAKAQDTLKFTMITPLEESLQKTIDWYYSSEAWK